MHPRQGEMNPVRTVSGQVRPARHGPIRRRPALYGANEVALFRGLLCIRISMPSDTNPLPSHLLCGGHVMSEKRNCSTARNG